MQHDIVNTVRGQSGGVILNSNGMIRIFLLFPGLRRFVYLVRRGGGLAAGQSYYSLSLVVAMG